MKQCKKQIAVIDYGAGNLFSLVSSLNEIGIDAIVTNNKQKIDESNAIILPGVGAFSDAIKNLKKDGLDIIIKEQVQKGKPLLGICLGMQMLFEKSYEYGEYEGLSLIKGNVISMKGKIPDNLKIPHIGWNSLKFKKESSLFKYINNGDYVYFVHSYYADDCSKNTIAVADYGIPITAAVQKENIYGCQFHPEKSGKIGLSILKSFCEN